MFKALRGGKKLQLYQIAHASGVSSVDLGKMLPKMHKSGRIQKEKIQGQASYYWMTAEQELASLSGRSVSGILVGASAIHLSERLTLLRRVAQLDAFNGSPVLAAIIRDHELALGTVADLEKE